MSITITGRAMFNGQPVANADCIIDAGSVSWITKTNSNGYFSMTIEPVIADWRIQAISNGQRICISGRDSFNQNLNVGEFSLYPDYEYMNYVATHQSLINAIIQYSNLVYSQTITVNKTFQN